MSPCGRSLVALGLAFWATGVLATQSGVVRTDAELRAAPYTDAHLLTTLPKDLPLGIQERRGGWIRVKTDPYGEGWIRLHQVRIGDGADRERSSVSGLSALWRSFTGRGGSRGLVATTGIRGLEAQDLRDTKPDPEAVKELEGYRVAESEARAFAAAAGLKPQQVSYDPDQKKKKKHKKKRD